MSYPKCRLFVSQFAVFQAIFDRPLCFRFFSGPGSFGLLWPCIQVGLYAYHRLVLGWISGLYLLWQFTSLSKEAIGNVKHCFGLASLSLLISNASNNQHFYI